MQLKKSTSNLKKNTHKRKTKTKYAVLQVMVSSTLSSHHMLKEL